MALPWFAWKGGSDRVLVWPTIPSTCQDDGATKDGSSKETSNLEILLIICILKRLPKAVVFLPQYMDTQILLCSIKICIFCLSVHSIKICTWVNTKFLTKSCILWKQGEIVSTRLVQDLWLFCYCTVPVENFCHWFVSCQFPAPNIWQGAYAK